MLKAHKKSISLIVVLTFLLSLFPMALPAFAADYARVGSVISVNDDKVVKLNRARAEFSKGELKQGDEVIISLPKDFEFCRTIPPGSTNPTARIPMTEANWNAGGFDNDIELSYDGGGEIDCEIDRLGLNEIKLTVNETIDAADEVNLFIDLGAVYVDEDFDGDIQLKFDAVPGSGFDDGEVIVGRVTGGEVTVEVTEDDTFSADTSGEVTIRIEEDRAGALAVDEESVKITLPEGFEWAALPVSGASIGSGSASDVWLVSGAIAEVAGYRVYIHADELTLDVDARTSTKPALIEINAEVTVENETNAKLGNVIADVEGESDISPSEITLGTYGNYEVTATAAAPTTVYAGLVEQKIADFTIEEIVKGSLSEGRSITLTLPEWAKWGALPDSVADGVTLDLISFPGKDGQVARYEVVGSSDNPAELDFEDMEVVLAPRAPAGDLIIKFGGTAGVEGDVKVAEVAKPFILQVAGPPVLAIGTANQPLGEITIAEDEAGLINENRPLVLILPKDIPWEDYQVEVIKGDLEIGDSYDRVNPATGKNYLYIDIEDESNEASVIKVTAEITVFRTVPEGKVLVGLGGPAVIETQDPSALAGQYGNAVDGYFRIAGLAVAENDEIFPVEDTTGGGIAAFIGTPAPGETQLKVVFILGSTNFTQNDVVQAMDAAPYAKHGRTYLPMRYVAKALGIKDTGILWENSTATFISGDKVVSITVGSKIISVNGVAVPIDAAPEIVRSRTMLPIKWITAAFGIDVNWDAATQQVTIK